MSKHDLKLAQRRRRRSGPHCVMCGLKLHKAQPMPLETLLEVSSARALHLSLAQAIADRLDVQS